MNTNELLKNFKSPPSGYGIVPFYWWMGDPLLKERLSDELDMLAGHNISGLQVNYAHSDVGGRAWGLTYESDPPIFSEEWWELFGWFMSEAKKRGMSVSLSDYTLFSPGQEQVTDRILARRPEMRGSRLVQTVRQIKRGEPTRPGEVPGEILEAVLISGGREIQLSCSGSEVSPDDGELRIICAETVPFSYDPMHPAAGEEIINGFFGQFEKRFPGECGKGLNFFFSDELDFGIGGNLWNRYFADEFIKRKGYDIRPLLHRIFTPGKPESVAVRMDYYDVIVALEEENYFSRIYNWHEERGMTYGCDHGGRGYNVVEFGDYMRTQKYNQGPGCDQPRLSSDIVKNKVASSISHLHRRPRVWLEGFYGSGWGTSAEQLTDAVARNFVMGQNLLSLHGLYYSTHGGYWEWAPPCNCIHMPYWEHMKKFTAATERLSYIMTRGVHCCHVGIIYPVAAFDGGIGGDQAASAAFHMADRLYSQGIDLDYLDRESITGAGISDGELVISGERYRYVVIPDMRVLHADVYRKLLEAAKAGLRVISVVDLPEFSDGDVSGTAAELAPMAEIFRDVKDAVAYLAGTVPRDIIPSVTREYYVNHRRTDGAEIYMTYGIPKGEKCFFRGAGNVMYLSPWDGKTYGIDAEHADGGVYFRMPVCGTGFQLFLVGDAVPEDILPPEETVTVLPLGGEWDFTVVPTMNNRWGDYELPATDGILPCQLKEVTCGGNRFRITYGTYFLAKECFADTASYRRAVADAAAGRTGGFSPYDFSMRFGIEDMPGHQGYHGLKGNISNDFLAVGRAEFTQTSERFLPYENGTGKVFFTFILCDRPTEAEIIAGGILPESLFVNGQRAEPGGRVLLNAGANPVAAGYTECGRGHLIFAVGDPDKTAAGYPLSMKWYHNPSVLPFGIHGSGHVKQTFTFMSPPGLRSAEIFCAGNLISVSAEGRYAILRRGRDSVTADFGRCLSRPTLITIVAESTDGKCGGAMFERPANLFCGKGKFPAGDWTENDGLKFYSGSADYSRTFRLTEEQCRQRVVLVLDRVISTAEVTVNGISAGIRVAPDWEWDITEAAKPGENTLSVRVCNTAGNHYGYIPTRFRSGTGSGIIGNTRIVIRKHS